MTASMITTSHRRPNPRRAEWIKTVGSRGVLWAYGLLVVLSVGFSALVVANTPSTDPPGVLGDDDIVANTLVGVLVSVVIAAVIGATAIGGEHRSGMVTTSYLATPRRHRVVLAKTLVVAAGLFVVGVGSSYASYLVARPLQRGQGYIAPSYPEPDLLSGPALRSVIGTGMLIALFGVYAVGVTAIVRRTSIAIPMVVGTVILPGLLASSDRIQEFVQRWTPFAGFSIQHTVDRNDYYAGPWHGLAVMAVVAVVALAVGLVVTHRRDA